MLNIISQQNYKRQERGSVFFYILLAIALLAALSYAVSRDRGSSANIFTDEQAKIAAQEIIEYGDTIAKAVAKLRLRGCSSTQINFENPVIAGYSNASAPTDKSCDVFNSNGGNVNFQTFGDDVYDLTKPAMNKISFNAENAIADIGSGEGNLIAFHSVIKQSICENINKLLYQDSTVFTQTDINVGVAQFNGSYNATPTTICSPLADGKTSGCCHETTGCNGTDCYHFYQVLIAQ